MPLYLPELIQIQFRFAFIAFHDAAKNFIAAVRTCISGFLILNPFLIPELSSIWDSAEDDLFADRHGETFNVLTRKIIALMATGVSFLFRAVPDVTLLTKHELVIR